MGWDVKFRALVDAIHDFDVHLVKGEPEALLLESRLIKEYRPRYNVSLRRQAVSDAQGQFQRSYSKIHAHAT